MPEPCFFCADPNTVICTFCNIFATCIQHVDIHRPDQVYILYITHVSIMFIHRPDQVLYCTALYNSTRGATFTT